ncbi:hypothetical protein A3H85_00350 [Candidatus Daviesbacteria bacterium RIFCSPLOWO2_02_FULL_40_8]|uniref:DUF4389 domain-containing protein n=1 Tax=Candidatus Daviesbacteria bacterium RIFCSPLOWO2_01_FULL_40_24 TaxID=1797787 RepID=A0A1F5MJZ3_9BACT|nr:MAG: hypothetical protein A2780_02015 [Candidatus Daviesbacteria bacterium RIFCSPHIGHO2_01_FULL_41_45]OGE34357.1 MAG: hypothetical protein A3C32_02070 [Candidatus Daviesbacteria bacterium RIFCSPHIGHO2_02_FULL_41_14]OGE65675.1 MAG: hypothetical protein A3B49_03870 [Candidatus Daviesbacteria bacterium RIFCSPLOWO2_01_FULL_40_24]OGE66062.1 MAG: hypothetical protein A3H85_00350 [Candidatus Daviesbacteria bacterium RIFCSPLOWO2_02_FULL_40_8]
MNKFISWLFNKDRVYPQLIVENINHPNRFYAVPLIGGLVKIIAVIPVLIVLFFVGIYLLFIDIINSFVVLFKGTYWQYAYEMNLSLMKLSLKMQFYFLGITDRYPGFDFKVDDRFTLDIPIPQNPSRLFALPVVGGLMRLILIMPVGVYHYILDETSRFTVNILAWFWVLFKGRYPEWIYELTRDSERVELSMWAYLSGLSDEYPSLYISMNHKTAKLVFMGLLLMLGFAGFFIPDASPNLTNSP